MFAVSHRIPEEKQIILTALVPYTVPYTVQEGPQHVSDSAYTYTADSRQAVHHCPRGEGGGKSQAALAVIMNHIFFSIL